MTGNEVIYPRLGIRTSQSLSAFVVGAFVVMLLLLTAGASVGRIPIAFQTLPFAGALTCYRLSVRILTRLQSLERERPSADDEMQLLFDTVLWLGNIGLMAAASCTIVQLPLG